MDRRPLPCEADGSALHDLPAGSHRHMNDDQPYTAVIFTSMRSGLDDEGYVRAADPDGTARRRTARLPVDRKCSRRRRTRHHGVVLAHRIRRPRLEAAPRASRDPTHRARPLVPLVPRAGRNGRARLPVRRLEFPDPHLAHRATGRLAQRNDRRRLPDQHARGDTRAGGVHPLLVPTPVGGCRQSLLR